MSSGESVNLIFGRLVSSIFFFSFVYKWHSFNPIPLIPSFKEILLLLMKNSIHTVPMHQDHKNLSIELRCE